MNWVSVVSSVFSDVAYDDDRRRLYLKFHGGRIWRYFEFPPHQYVEFLAAESLGKYFGKYIRGKFREEEVRQAPLHRELTYSSSQ